MKKIFLIASALVFSFASMAQTKADDIIKVGAEKHNFGKIPQGKPVIYNFELKNISDKPVVVENASASCGCTVPEKPTKPIMPGETAKLKVQYNAAVVGPINKEVYVKFAGVEQTKTLYITGEVVAADPTPAAPAPTDAKKPATK